MDYWILIIVDIGEKLVPWLITIVLGLLGKYVYAKIKSDHWRDIIGRATAEVFDVVRDVHQVYVKQIRKQNEDGKLTVKEKAIAKELAFKTLKANLGPKGFARLVKVIGGETATVGWAATKIESAVSAIKAVEKPLANPTVPLQIVKKKKK